MAVAVQFDNAEEVDSQGVIRALQDVNDLAAQFAQFDIDGSGKLEPGEFLKAVVELSQNECSEEVLQEVLHLVDIDDSGDIDYREFAHFIEAYTEPFDGWQLKPHFEPMNVSDKDTWGSKFIGKWYQSHKWLSLTNRPSIMLWLVFMFVWTMGLLWGAREKDVPMGVVVCSTLSGFIAVTVWFLSFNRQVVRLLVTNFTCLFMMGNYILLGLLLADLVGWDSRFPMFLTAAAVGVTACLSDASPPIFVNNSWTIWVICVGLALAVVIGMETDSLPGFEARTIDIGIEYNTGANLTNTIWNLSIFMARLLYYSISQPEKMGLVKSSVRRKHHSLQTLVDVKALRKNVKKNVKAGISSSVNLVGTSGKVLASGVGSGTKVLVSGVGSGVSMFATGVGSGAKLMGSALHYRDGSQEKIGAAAPGDMKNPGGLDEPDNEPSEENPKESLL